MKTRDLLSFRYIYERRKRIHRKLLDLSSKALRRCYIPLSRSDAKILAMKNRHRNRRAFVIGNGPSLHVEDLARLSNEITFASNKIYLAFSQTSWRPTYYFVTDKLVGRNNSDMIRQLPLRKFLSTELKSDFRGARDIMWLHEYFDNKIVLDALDGHEVERDGYFSENAFVGVEAGWTVIFTQLQMAFYMGITEVFLIGVDFSFDVPEKRLNTSEQGYEQVLQSAGEVNHFHPEYRKPGETWAIPRLDCQQKMFELAHQTFQKHGRRIFNASRKTKLEVFPRSDFESLVASAK